MIYENDYYSHIWEAVSKQKSNDFLFSRIMTTNLNQLSHIPKNLKIKTDMSLISKTIRTPSLTQNIPTKETKI
jgi:hypothetical protein